MVQNRRTVSTDLVDEYEALPVADRQEWRDALENDCVSYATADRFDEIDAKGAA